MLLNYNQYNFEEYDFLKLLISTMVVQEHNVCFNNDELEKQLYEFYGDERYACLLKKVSCQITEKEENNRVVLRDSFAFAYAFQLLTLLVKDGVNYSIIRLSKDDAVANINLYDVVQVEAMNSLCSELSKIKVSKSAKIYLFEKKKTT